MAITDILARFGAIGFLAVFEAIGVGAGVVVVSAARAAFRARRWREAPGLAFGIAFSLLFAGMPLVMAFGFAGWPGLLGQVAVLGTLVAFVVAPHGPPAAEAVAGAPRGWRSRIVGRPAQEAQPAGPWRRLLSALPAFAVAAGCVATVLGGSIAWMTREALCDLVRVEFLVIHSFPFLAMITLPRVGYRRWQVFQWFLFVTWSCLYLAFASQGEYGWSGIATFASGAVATYLGFLLRWNSGSRIAAVAKRWAASFVFFLVVAAITGSGGSQDSSAALWHGTLYFLALGLAEATGLHDLAWKRALKRWRSRPARPHGPSASRRERRVAETAGRR